MKHKNKISRILFLVILVGGIALAVLNRTSLKDSFSEARALAESTAKDTRPKAWEKWNFYARYEKDDEVWLKSEYPHGTPREIAKALSVDSARSEKTQPKDVLPKESKTVPVTETKQNTTPLPASDKTVRDGVAKANQKEPDFYFNLEMAKLEDMDFDKFFEKTGFVVYYNIEHKNPHFVCYELTKEELKTNTKRSDDFHNEDDIKNKYMGTVATLNDFKKSGFDRGHQAPSASLLWSEQANFDSFSTVNLSPQLNRFNANLNLKAENAERDAAREFGKIYCCTGPLLKGISKKDRKTIGDGVTVPEYFFKAWLVYDKSGKPHTLAVLMPQEYENGNLTPYFITVNDLEERTGIDFFFNLDDSIEEQAEGRYDLALWPASFK